MPRMLTRRGFFAPLMMLPPASAYAIRFAMPLLTPFFFFRDTLRLSLMPAALHDY